MSKVRFVVEIDETRYNHWKAWADSHEELPEDFNPDDYAGGNMDDCFWNGHNHGTNEMISEVFGHIVSTEAVK